MHSAEHCSAGGVAECTWICKGRLALMVYNSSLVGFSLHISTSSRSMSPLISRPLATRPTRVTPHSTGVPSGLKADEWQPASESLTAIQRTYNTNTAWEQLLSSQCSEQMIVFLNVLITNLISSSSDCLDTRFTRHMNNERVISHCNNFFSPYWLWSDSLNAHTVRNRKYTF